MRNSRVFTLLFLIPVAVFGQDTLNDHPVKLDSQGKLISWVQPQEQAYDRVMRLAWDFLLHKVLVEENGLKTYYTSCCIHPPSMQVSRRNFQQSSAVAGTALLAPPPGLKASAICLQEGYQGRDFFISHRGC